jgi:cystathionine beta-lyase/cystathionine gamma-synthase
MVSLRTDKDSDDEEIIGESTEAVHGGENVDPVSGAVAPPIYQTATFGFRTTEDVIRTVKGESGRELYTRWGNPTTSLLEAKVAKLERGESAVAFSSGMAAITSTFMSLLSKGDHIIAQRSVYGEAFNFINNFLPRFGIEVTIVDTCDYKAMEESFRENTKFVYVETPTNPTLRVVDLKRVARIANGRAITAVDSTFGTPINQKPILLGIDIVIHSATKYLNGHSDVIAGIVACKNGELAQRIRMTRRVLGGVIDPLAAWLTIRGLKTLSLRVKKQNENAASLAQFLSEHPSVSNVNYPGLKTNPDYEVAKRQMKNGFGGVLSFEVKGDIDDARCIVENLRFGILGGSLGGVETLVTQPSTTSHHQLSKEERLKVGISDSLIRVAVGIEDSKDIIRDFDKGLELIRKQTSRSSARRETTGGYPPPRLVGTRPK